jgi:hypothetical protein
MVPVQRRERSMRTERYIILAEYEYEPFNASSDQRATTATYKINQNEHELDTTKLQIGTNYEDYTHFQRAVTGGGSGG